MRSKLLFLTLLAVGMLTLAGSGQANLLMNCSFEETTGLDGKVADYWGDSDGTSGFYEVREDGTAYDGDKYMHESCEDGSTWAVIFQHNRPAVAGEACYMGGWVRDATQITTVGLKFEYYDGEMEMQPGNSTEPAAGEKAAHQIATITSTIFETAGTGDWERFAESNTAPAGTGAFSPVFVSLDDGSADEGYTNWRTAGFDLDVCFAANYTANWPWTCSGDIYVYDPVPEDQKTGTSTTTTELSFSRKNISGKKPLVEVWWGKQDDPNFWYVPGEAQKLMDLADTNFVDLTATLIGNLTPLAPETEYFWKVKFEDPNEGNWGNPVLSETSCWSFDTKNGPPVVDAGIHHTVWMATSDPCLTIGLDATVSDDGLPDGCSLTLAWTETLSNGATTPTYKEGRAVEDPNVIFHDAGDYVLTLTVDDGLTCKPLEAKSGSDSILVRIIAHDDDRLRAHYPLDTNATDSVGGHNGTLEDDPVFNPNGQVAGAIELDGTDDVGPDGFGDFVSIDDTGSDPNQREPDTWENSGLIDGMTVYAWMKLDEDGWSKGWETIVGKSGQSWELLRDVTNSGVAFSAHGGIGYPVSSADADVTSGWHQVAGVYNRNEVLVYVDGLVEGVVDAGTIDLEAESNLDYLGQPINDYDWQIPKSAGKICIGQTNNLDYPDGDYSFGGLIDQVRIFDAAVPWKADYPDTPGIVKLYRADGGHVSCGNDNIGSDLNGDCYVDLGDFAIVAIDWLECNDVSNADCD